MADFAELLGDAATVDVAEQKAGYENTLEQLRAVLGDRWSEVTAAYLQADGPADLATHGPTAIAPNAILNELGVTWVDVVLKADEEANGGYLGGISFEQLGQFDADLLFTWTFADSTVLGSDLYQSLGVVKAGQSLEFAQGISGTHYRNFIFIAEQLLDFVRGRDLRTDLVS